MCISAQARSVSIPARQALDPLLDFWIRLRFEFVLKSNPIARSGEHVANVSVHEAIAVEVAPRNAHARA